MSDRTKRRLGVSIGAVLLLALLIAGMLVVLSGGSATAKQIATLHIFEGQVEVQRAGAVSAGTEGQALHEGDTVRTGPDGRAEIEYFDGSLTRLDFGTSFAIETLEVTDDGQGSKIIEASQTAGGSYNRVTELTDSESRFDIDTPTATASVQGTVYAILVGPDGSTTIAVIEGMVVASSTGGLIDVPAGKMVVIGPDGSLGALEDIPPELLDSEWIVFNQCDLDQIRDCVLGEVVTPDEPQDEEPDEPDEPGESPSPPPAGPIPAEDPDPTDGGTEPPNAAPSAGMLVSDLMGPAPHTVSFTDASSDPDGDTLTRSWAFGDGSTHTGGTGVLHTYTAPGDYLATLTVTDPDGESDSVAALVQVTDGDAPQLTITGGPDDPSDSSDASFSFTSSEAGSGFFCSLDGAAASSCGGVSARLSDLLRAFGGPLAPVSGSASYSGLDDGPHSFQVSVTDDDGNTGSASWSWTIDTAPALDHITISPSSSTIALGGSQAYSATAFDTDGVSMGDVTGATVFSGANCSGNVCSPNAVGDHTVTGTYEGVSDSAVLHVLPVSDGGEVPVFDHIKISPSSATITYGGSQVYTALAVDTDGASMGDVTADTTFSGANCAGSVCTPTSAGPKTVTGTYAGSLGADSDDASLTVEKAPLQVTADDHDVTYGDADPEFTFAYAGFVAGDDAGDVDTPPTCGVDGDHQHVATYDIECSGGLDEDYAFSYVDGTLAVEKAELTVTADDKAKVQGTVNPALTFGISGFAYSEDESVLDTAPTCSTTAVTGSPVGNYAITCSGGDDGDYSFTYVDGNLQVTERPVITVTADDQTMTYGDPEPDFTFTYAPTPVGTIDTPPTCAVSYVGVTTEGYPNVGTHTIECSGASDDTYDFGYVSGTLTIEKASLAVVPLDETIEEGETPAFEVEYVGLVGEDTPGDIDVPPTCEAVEIVEGAAARLAPTVFDGGYEPGEYAIYCSNASDDNYDFTYEAIGTLTVLPVEDEGMIDHIVLSGQSGLAIGCTRTYTATLYDAGDSVIDDDITEVTFYDGDGGGEVTFPDGASVAATDGVATVDVLGAANGSVKLRATAGGLESNEIHFQVTPHGCDSASLAPAVPSIASGSRSNDEPSEHTSADRSRESGFRSLGIAILPLLGLRRRRH